MTAVEISVLVAGAASVATIAVAMVLMTRAHDRRARTAQPRNIAASASVFDELDCAVYRDELIGTDGTGTHWRQTDLADETVIYLDERRAPDQGA